MPKVSAKTKLLVMGYFAILIMIVMVVGGSLVAQEYLSWRHKTGSVPAAKMTEALLDVAVITFATAGLMGIFAYVLFCSRKYVNSDS